MAVENLSYTWNRVPWSVHYNKIRGSWMSHYSVSVIPRPVVRSVEAEQS